MGLKGSRLFDTQRHGGLGIGLRAVFAAQDQIADRVLEAGIGADQFVRQVEHHLILAIRHCQPQVRVKDRQRLSDQIQPGTGQIGAELVRGHGCATGVRRVSIGQQAVAERHVMGVFPPVHQR